MQWDADRCGTRGDGRGNAGRGVLDRDAVPRIDSEQLRGPEVRGGVRLGVFDLVARDHDAERVEVDGVAHDHGEPADRHRDEGRGHARRTKLEQQLSCPWAPRQPTLDDLGEHHAGQAVDDLLLGERDATGLQHPGRVECQRPWPTRVRASSWVQTPPCSAMSSVSAFIQKGSVSMMVPSMSQRTAAG